MNMMKKFLISLNFFVFDIFSSLPLSTPGTLRQPQKNTIFGSVQAKPSSLNNKADVSIASAPSTAKTIVPMPLVSDTTIASNKSIPAINDMQPKIAKSEQAKNTSIIKTSQPEKQTDIGKTNNIKDEVSNLNPNESLEISKNNAMQKTDSEFTSEPINYEKGVLYQKEQFLTD